MVIQYMSARDAAEKWNVSQRRVSILCAENRIPNVAMLGNMWLIPRDAEKPVDARMKRNEPHAKDSARPFVKWAGGKGQLLPILKNNLPEGMGTKIRKYAEPFVGGGALLFALLNEYSFDEVYINDSNKALMNAFLVIRDDCDGLVARLKGLQSDYDARSEEEQRQFFYAKREEFNETALTEENRAQKAALFLFLNRTCFNGLYRVNKSGKFNVPAGKYKNPLICDEENLRKISSLIQNVTIKSTDYHDVENFADDSTFVYIDPPYRPLNATSGFTSYTEERFGDAEQTELASFYKKLSDKGAKVLLSNSDPKNADVEDNFFDDLYAEFDVQRITAVRAINSKGAKRGNVTELLIRNY